MGDEYVAVCESAGVSAEGQLTKMMQQFIEDNKEK
uniref:Uncharacterized protein n=1 Tax=Siphoviridae sp. ctacm4 TaxID=2827895 RepID=A0A8S5TE04_9CAUD|nr:MAG TPA: hypothetical protein [Siphoviridae sp. ctacm4]